MERELLSGFKVVREGSKQLRSAVISKKGRKIYRKGHTTKRSKHCGPLAVFKTLVQAMCFVSVRRPWSSVVIYKCTYLPSVSNVLSKPSIDRPGLSDCFFNVPPGTDFADEVTLLRKVTQEEEIQSMKEPYQ